MADVIRRGRWYPDMPPVERGEGTKEYRARLTGDQSPYDHSRMVKCALGLHPKCTGLLPSLRCECPCHRLTEGLRADGFTDPLPMPGTVWLDTQADYLPPGQRRIVRLTSTAKTVTGWQVRLVAYVVDEEDQVVSGPNDGILYANRLLAWYRLGER
jgi:hypothetical protein